MLQISATSHGGDRRATVSALSQLRSGTILAPGFPKYALTSSYKHPLDEAGQKVEKAAIASVTANTAMDYLKKLVAFPTRSYSNADASNKVEAFLKQQFEAEGLHTCYHTFKDSQGELTNVVGHVPGSQPGAVIVGAHYDSRPFNGDAPGAEDNGSGVASMLAMVKAFMQTKTKPKKSIFFVAFAGEEPGLIGSAHFAEALKTDSLPVECTASSFLQVHKSKKNMIRRNRKNSMSQYRAIIMDEIGWKSPQLSEPTINLESYDEQGKEVMDHLRHSAQMHLGDKVDVVHNAHPFGSDHMSFLDNDVAAVLTINGDDEAYPCYHQSCDTIDHVDPDLMMMVTKMNLGAMMRMSMA
jgi:Zn-dependent M28 family amino/carboxypeptidase